jgi:osmoprotectant transport system permease protein
VGTAERGGDVSALWDFLGTGSNWTGRRGIAARTWAQLWVSLVACALAAGLALPPAVWLAHHRRLPRLATAVANIGQAIPTFAIIALVLPFSIRWGFGLGFWPTAVALVALGLPPIFTSAYAGVAGTPASLVEAATGVGMRGREVLRKVELPVATPLVLTGVRIALVQIVATATLGALVGYECLGTYVIEGLQRPRGAKGRLLGGGLLVAALALSVDQLVQRLEPRLAPWARRATVRA